MLYYDVVSSIPFYESLSKKRRKIPADDRVEFHAGQIGRASCRERVLLMV